MAQAFEHRPVMVDEVVDLFRPVPAGVVVDATLGGAGHARALLHARPDLSLVGIDRDADAVDAARAALAAEGLADRAVVVHARFDALADVVAEHAAGGVVGVLLDLGVSSPQLDRGDRGFSYRSDAPLDMRMDRRDATTAADLVNRLPEAELTALLAENGEGRFARRIARAIIAARPLSTTGELVDVVRAAIPAPARRTGGHPAKRVFQALRIAVNDELEVLERVLPQALDALVPGGRCVVLSYHSGEDRLVKAAFGLAATGGCTCPPTLPCGCGATPTHVLVRRGSRGASPAEIAENPRAESARLRAAERIAPRPTTPQEGSTR